MTSASPDGGALPWHSAACCLMVAGLRIAVEGEGLRSPLGVDPAAWDFVSDVPAGVDLSLTAATVEGIQAPAGPTLFASGELWQVFEEDGGLGFYFRSGATGDEPYAAACLARDGRTGRIRLRDAVYPFTAPVYPLRYPLDELLVTHLLPQYDGVEVHACGLVTPGGRGLLFTGHSGAGKSTTARYWQCRSGVRVLSDDRIVLRREGNSVRMYGTPWHGDAGLSSPGSALLSAVYALRQGEAVRCIPQAQTEAVAGLFSFSFLPLYDRRAVETALGVLQHAAERVPCQVLEFPDSPAVVRSILAQLGEPMG